jgi:hypothetical protein
MIITASVGEVFTMLVDKVLTILHSRSLPGECSLCAIDKLSYATKNDGKKESHKSILIN